MLSARSVAVMRWNDHPTFYLLLLFSKAICYLGIPHSLFRHRNVQNQFVTKSGLQAGVPCDKAWWRLSKSFTWIRPRSIPITVLQMRGLFQVLWPWLDMGQTFTCRFACSAKINLQSNCGLVQAVSLKPWPFTWQNSEQGSWYWVVSYSILLGQNEAQVERLASNSHLNFQPCASCADRDHKLCFHFLVLTSEIYRHTKKIVS